VNEGPRPLRPPDPPLRDGDALVRGFTEADHEPFLRGAAEPDVAHFAYADIMTTEMLRERLPLWPDRMMRGEAINLVLCRPDGEFAGSLLLRSIDWFDMDGEIGFWLAPEARGRGLGARGIRLLARYAFSQGLERIHARTDLDNDAAQTAMERAGMHREGVLRGGGRGRDGRVDLLSYSMLATDLGEEGR